MARKKLTGRVMMVRIGGRGDDSLEVRFGTLDRDNPRLPSFTDYAGDIKSGVRFLADCAAVGATFIRRTWQQPTDCWDASIRLGWCSKYAYSFFDAYRAEELAATLKWLGKRVYEVLQERGTPSTADEGVALLAEAAGVDCVFVQELEEWVAYSDADSYRRAIRRMEERTFKREEKAEQVM